MLVITLIDRQALALHQGKVVKGSTCSQLIAAHECITRAERYALQIKAGIEAEAEQARKRAYDDGMALAKKEFAQRMTETVLRLEGAYLGLEARLVNIVMHTLQTVLGTLDDALILERLVQQCIRAAGQEKRLSLRVSEEQLEAAKSALSSLLSSHAHIECIDVLTDPRLKKNSCVLETEYGAIDGSLDTHLTAIRQGLIDAFAEKRTCADVAVARDDATSHAGSRPC